MNKKFQPEQIAMNWLTDFSVAHRHRWMQFVHHESLIGERFVCIRLIFYLSISHWSQAHRFPNAVDVACTRPCWRCHRIHCLRMALMLCKNVVSCVSKRASHPIVQCSSVCRTPPHIHSRSHWLSTRFAKKPAEKRFNERIRFSFPFKVNESQSSYFHTFPFHTTLFQPFQRASVLHVCAHRLQQVACVSQLLSTTLDHFCANGKLKNARQIKYRVECVRVFTQTQTKGCLKSTITLMR